MDMMRNINKHKVEMCKKAIRHTHTQTPETTSCDQFWLCTDNKTSLWVIVIKIKNNKTQYTIFPEYKTASLAFTVYNPTVLLHTLCVCSRTPLLIVLIYKDKKWRQFSVRTLKETLLLLDYWRSHQQTMTGKAVMENESMMAWYDTVGHKEKADIVDYLSIGAHFNMI